MKIFMGDFETTSYDGQLYTEVWASALVEVGVLEKSETLVFNSIKGMWDYLLSLNEKVIVYFHNLKFDGSFILDYLLIQKGYKEGIVNPDDEIENQVFKKARDLRKKELIYSISSMGLWYKIIVKTTSHQTIEFRDSLKLLPFPVEEIGKGFNTMFRKTTIEYKGFRAAFQEISEEEEDYIKNDVLVVSEALKYLQDNGINKLTIGSSALSYYKKLMGKTYKVYFPNLYEEPLDFESFNATNAGEYIRRAYKGAWTYLVKGKEKKKYKNGITLDVNSLYPYVMHSSSGNVYPIGLPHFWKGNKPDYITSDKYYYFIRIKCRFQIKNGYLPFIQIKNNLLYKSIEMLETSDIKSNIYDGKYFSEYIDTFGEKQPAKVELTLTCADWLLFQKHYNIYDLEVLDGCYFDIAIGIFDEYIDRWIKIKQENTGAIRTLAKLMLNALYGKFAASTDSSYKRAIIVDNCLKFITINKNDKVPGYIPVGAAITSYARCYTISHAQSNFYGKDNPGFIYADTDSMHLDLPIEEVKNVKIDDKKLGFWALEKKWKIGWFVRSKCYIELEEDRCGNCTKSVEGCRKCFSITCAGMPKNSKNLFRESVTQKREMRENERWNEFTRKKRNIEDFREGLVVPGKLRPVRIPGGMILDEIDFTFRNS